MTPNYCKIHYQAIGKKAYDIKPFIEVFEKYTNSFLSNHNSENTNHNIQLKISHSKRVFKNAEDIARSENFVIKDLFIAQLCGLFHDIGRFEQFTKYKTFKDDDSVYHGSLGVDVLKGEGFLSNLSSEIQEIVFDAVYNHGLIRIKEIKNSNSTKFCKLVRDADKIDIFRIVAKYYKSSGPRNIALEYGLKDSPIISDSVMQKFRKKALIEKEELNTLNDFKAMQLAWIFDINFPFTRKVIFESKDLNIILESISSVEQRDELREIILKNITNIHN